MRILHITNSVGSRSYGLGQVALNLMKSQLAQNNEPVIWTLDSAEDLQRNPGIAELPKGCIRCFPPLGPEIVAWSPAMMRAARLEGNRFDVVHQHGIWTAQSRVTNLLRERHRLPTVVAPHGSLEPRVLLKSRVKKRMAQWVYEAANLHGASCIHATAPTEVADIETFGLRNPIALIPNGISQTWLDSTGDGSRFRSKFGLPHDRRVLLFMSRIAPKKGLPMLLQAWSRLSPAHPEWMLVVVGGDEDGHKAEVEALASQLGLLQHVRFVDPILGQDKRDAFAAADLFILPSHSEGFPMVVLDALGAGVPAIVTRASAWEDLETHGCGWWVDISATAIVEALEDALGHSPESLSTRGAAGRKLVELKYHWRALSSHTLDLYDWLCHRGTKPPFVTLPVSGGL